jgi:hypothetical protein
MEQLDPSQRESVKKMSTERLRTKLTEVGFDETKVNEMQREQLLDAWAKVVLGSQDLPPPEAAAKAPTVGYDVELEKRRLEFEMKKFELEEARRKEERQWEEARRKAEIEATKLREEKEAEERIAVYKLQEQELHIRRDQWEWQKQRDLREGEKQQTPAAQVKFFGNVLKNVMPRFPNDVADVPIFFWRRRETI